MTKLEIANNRIQELESQVKKLSLNLPVRGEFKPAYEYVIKNIKQGEGDFRSKILYATVERIGEGMVCSATVDFILRMYYGRRDKIENYEEVLGMFLDFYDKLIRRV